MKDRVVEQYKELASEYTDLREYVKFLDVTRQKTLEEAADKFKKLYELRLELLLQKLDRKNLALCTKLASHTGRSLEKYGVFPKGRMRFLYTNEDFWVTTERERFCRQVEYLDLLCPLHYPSNLNKTWKSYMPNSDKPSIQRGVIEKMGKLFTDLELMEITINPRRPYPSEALFRKLGIPRLP